MIYRIKHYSTKIVGKIKPNHGISRYSCGIAMETMAVVLASLLASGKAERGEEETSLVALSTKKTIIYLQIQIYCLPLQAET
jgi:hypothetical protein